MNNSSFLMGAATVAKWITDSFPIVRMVLIILMVVLSLAMVLVVMIQPSNSEGMGAISGQSNETYYSKNKSKSLEGIMKRLTIIIAICLFVVSILFFVTVIIYPVGSMV